MLKTVSAYELKAWLSINVIVSYLVDLGRGMESFFWSFIPCAAVLLLGVGMIALSHQHEETDKKSKGILYLLLNLFIAAHIKRGPLTKSKLIGTIAALTAVTVMTILIYINRGTI